MLVAKIIDYLSVSITLCFISFKKFIVGTFFIFFKNLDIYHIFLHFNTLLYRITFYYIYFNIIFEI